MKNEQSPISEIWENIKSLLGLVFLGFLYGVGSLALLYTFLHLLGINIIVDNDYRLLFLVWGGWIIGYHLYFKNKEEKRLYEQLELLRQGKSVTYPHPKLIEEREKEQEANERTEAKEQIGRTLTDTEWEEVKSFRDKQREVLKKEREERVPSAFIIDDFKWMKKRQQKNENEYSIFLKRYTKKYSKLPIFTEPQEKEEEFEVLVRLPQDEEVEFVERDPKIKAIQIFGVPSSNKLPKKETEPPSSPKRLLIPFSLSAEEAYEKLVAYLGEKKQQLETESMGNLEKSDPDKNYIEYKERFKSMTDGQLMDAFNREVGNSGWTSSRASYLVALREEFEKRKIIPTDKKK